MKCQLDGGWIGCSSERGKHSLSTGCWAAGLITDYTQNIFLTKCFDSFFMFQLSPDATLH